MNSTPPSPDAPALSAVFDQTALATDGHSVARLLVTVTAPEIKIDPDRPRPSLNLALVIDASGSMDGAPLAAAKGAALEVISALAPQDHLSLVSFASDAVRHADAVALDDPGREILRSAIAGIVTRGSTNLSAGWLDGCEAVATRQAACVDPERNHVVLLSDGHANRGETSPAALNQHASALRERGIITSTVGIGIQYSPTQLQAIAESGGGRMHDAERSDEIAEIVVAELRDTFATALEQVEVRLILPAGVKVSAYGTAPFTPDGKGCTVLLGSMLSGASRKLALELRVPPGVPRETVSVGLSVRWRVPGLAEVVSRAVSVPALKRVPDEQLAEATRDGAVARTVAELWHAHIVYRAIVLNQDGAGERARDFIQEELARLRPYCEDLPELNHRIAELERLCGMVDSWMAASTSKEFMLQTYKLSRGEVDRRRRGQVSMDDLMELERDIRARSRVVPKR
jgi:Ca-activated chloride channel family protein